MYRALPEKTKRTIRELVKQGMSYRDVCASLRVSMGSVYNAVHEEKYRPDEDIRKVAAAIKPHIQGASATAATSAGVL